MKHFAIAKFQLIPENKQVSS